MKIRLLFCRVADLLGHPVAICGVPLLCLAYLRIGWGVDDLTLVLSVVALSFSQFVLLSSRRFEAAVSARLDELIAATADARDDLLRAEQMDEQEIEALRR